MVCVPGCCATTSDLFRSVSSVPYDIVTLSEREKSDTKLRHNEEAHKKNDKYADHDIFSWANRERNKRSGFICVVTI